MKKVLFMTGLLAGMSLFTMAQTSPAAPKREKKEVVHHKSDSTAKTSGHMKKHDAGKKTKEHNNN